MILAGRRAECMRSRVLAHDKASHGSVRLRDYRLSLNRAAIARYAGASEASARPGDFIGGRYWDRTSGPCRVETEVGCYKSTICELGSQLQQGLVSRDITLISRNVTTHCPKLVQGRYDPKRSKRYPRAVIEKFGTGHSQTTLHTPGVSCQCGLPSSDLGHVPSLFARKPVYRLLATSNG